MGQCGIMWVGRLLLLLQLMSGVLSWGEEGHYAVCKIAEGYLTKDAVAAVKELLPESAKGDLASLCSWPDEIRKTYRWSSALHFADTPDLECNYDYRRDCHDTAGNKDRCVTGAIYNYTTQLTSVYQNSNSVHNYNLTEALIFLSHFMGDVHQPLHMGYLGDLGGNLIAVYWINGTKTNLHRVWDDLIIQSAITEFYDSDLSTMIKSIRNNMTENWSNELSEWERCGNNDIVCPNPYASESISLACKFAYPNVTAGSTLEDDYFLTRLPIVEKRVAQGGIRLAATLNRIFASQAKIAQA